MAMLDSKYRKPKDSTAMRFPDGFLWGTATSAYQVEGGNIHADWWDWEHEKFKNHESRITNQGIKTGLKSIHNATPEERDVFLSGKGADHYHRFKADFDLAKQMGNNAHRLSIEWSRIEPHEGVFDSREIQHYHDVLKSLKDRGMSVMVTLHHFTNPSWFAARGGWTKRRNIRFFTRFVQRVVEEYDHYVDFWITINEPNVYVQMSFLGGWGSQAWPPEIRSFVKMAWVFLNMARAHKLVYQIIHARDVEHKIHRVGFGQNYTSYATVRKHNLYDLLIVFLADSVANHGFYWFTRGYNDYLGVNYYFRIRFRRRRFSLIPDIVNTSEQGREHTDMGFEIYPHGIYSCLMDLRDYGIPIYITENGLAANDDGKRVRFLINYIQELYYALRAGVPVKGYFHWSLLDNYEWDLGYSQSFGLVAVNRQTGERTPKPSYYIYQKICESNGIPEELMLYGMKQ